MGASKIHVDKDFLTYARLGDALLLDIMSRFVKQTPEIDNHLVVSYTSNDFIENFHVPIRDKAIVPKGVKRRVSITNKLKGDKVEAYLYFLYVNYGRESAERYVIRNLKKYIA